MLDSNVWIDILVFDDPITRPIRAALEAGTLEALIDARCLKELTYVLDYPQFARFAVDKSEALETVARLSQLVAPDPLPEARHRRTAVAEMPRSRRPEVSRTGAREQGRLAGIEGSCACLNSRNARRATSGFGSPSPRRSWPASRRTLRLMQKRTRYDV